MLVACRVHLEPFKKDTGVSTVSIVIVILSIVIVVMLPLKVALRYLLVKQSPEHRKWDV